MLLYTHADTESHCQAITTVNWNTNVLCGFPTSYQLATVTVCLYLLTQ